MIIAGVLLFGCAGQDAVEPATSSQVVVVTVAGSAVVNPPASLAEMDPLTSDVAATSEVDSTTGMTDLMVEALALLGYSNPQESAQFLGLNKDPAVVAKCMAEVGFEWIPGPSPEEEIADNPYVSMTPDDFAAKYGFGDIAGLQGAFNSPPDPNDAYVQSLSNEAEDQYYQELFRCRGNDSNAEKEANASNAAVTDFRELINADPRVLEALGNWKSCLQGEGYEAETPQEFAGRYTKIANNSSSDEWDRLLIAEIDAAVANAKCEMPVQKLEREITIERFPEFQELYDTYLVSTSDDNNAQG